MSPGGEQDGLVEAIELEPDFYALSLSPQAPCGAAFAAPIASAVTQLAVLWFLAFQNENMFEEGKWKQPISPYWSLNVMKPLSLYKPLKEKDLRYSKMMMHQTSMTWCPSVLWPLDRPYDLPTSSFRG